MTSFYTDILNIPESIVSFVEQREQELKTAFEKLEKIKEYNQIKVLRAMEKNKLAATDFASSTGYGYGDVGREKTEKIYSDVFHTEDALVRPTIASGTHALSVTLKGMLRPGDELLSITGDPYDTLQEVIGITGDSPGNLKEYNISYNKVDLKNGCIDIEKAISEIKNRTALVIIQRSTGYSLRPALSMKQIKEAIEAIKKEYPELPIMVDNCYGEFTNTHEPSDYGADLTVGSLIKNPGGSIALSGGYIVGKSEYIQRIANELTAPGLGKETGLTFGTTRLTLQGLYLSPMITMEALKSAMLFGAVFDELGYPVIPAVDEERSDIIQAIVLGDKEKVIDFCGKIQASSAVDSHVTPWPWAMPGYEDEVIMASGSFIEGSSIEISADGPLREPYTVYYQGSMNFYQAKYALMNVLYSFYKNDNLGL